VSIRPKPVHPAKENKVGSDFNIEFLSMNPLPQFGGAVSEPKIQKLKIKV
jgi:hypothetical protein